MLYKHIDTIDFSSCETVIKNRLYYHLLNNKYYKVWEEGTVLWDRKIGDLFLLATGLGFYEGLAEFKTLISDNGTCVGYVMDGCECPMKDTGGIITGEILRHKNKHDFSVFKNASEQDEKYQRFFNTLKNRAQETGFFYYDLVQSNVADLGARYGIIDLESVAHIRDLFKIPQYHLDNLPADYLEFLRRLYNERIGIWNNGINMKLIEQAWSMSTGGIGFKPYYSVVINGRYFEGERPWETRWAQFNRAIDWNGIKILDLGTCMGVVPAYLLKFRNINSATAIDLNAHHIEATKVVRKAFRIPEEKMKIIPIDLDNSDYEEILGYDFDVIFCLSFFRWIKNKERLLKYLSNFENIIFEAHDLDGDVVSTFKDIGFQAHKVLGESRIGRNTVKKRTMYYFSKTLLDNLLILR